ncbi:unnamed protein product [Lactuca saligna]|uniref:Uncharacterized protein n=1 Tax=Lactuca saligna TaxID=75948 RepID=A0AA35YW00_LACSI|nr:unnamed protein product [Lactuca saligna]
MNPTTISNLYWSSSALLNQASSPPLMTYSPNPGSFWGLILSHGQEHTPTVSISPICLTMTVAFGHVLHFSRINHYLFTHHRLKHISSFPLLGLHLISVFFPKQLDLILAKRSNFRNKKYRLSSLCDNSTRHSQFLQSHHLRDIIASLNIIPYLTLWYYIRGFTR